MKTLSVGLILAIAGGLSMSTGRSEAPSPQIRLAGVNPAQVATDPAVASPRPSPHVARRLDDHDRNSVLGVLLLVTLQGGKAR